MVARGFDLWEESMTRSGLCQAGPQTCPLSEPVMQMRQRVHVGGGKRVAPGRCLSP